MSEDYYHEGTEIKTENQLWNEIQQIQARYHGTVDEEETREYLELAKKYHPVEALRGDER